MMVDLTESAEGKLPETSFAPLYGEADSIHVPRRTDQSVLAAAFRLYNDVTSVYQAVSAGYNTPDPTFNYRDHLTPEMQNPMVLPLLAGARSEGEFQNRWQRIQQETSDKELLASSGWGGSFAGLLAGAASPTMLIPFSGQARGLKALVEVMALGATAGAIQEGSLYASQLTMTEDELAMGIASQAALAGLMGGAWLSLSRSGRARLASNFDQDNNFVDVPQGDLDMGVPMRSERVRVDTQDAATYRRPDPEGRDVHATARTMEEPDLRPGFRRYYYSGQTDSGPLTMVSDREAMAGKDLTEGFYYRDVPEGEVQGTVVPGQTLDEIQSPGQVVELVVPEGEAQNLVRVFRGTEPPKVDLLEPGPGGARVVDEAGMDVSLGETPIRDSIDPGASRPGRSVGAASAGRQMAMGTQAAKGPTRQALLNILGHVSPMYRAAQSQFGAVRDFVFRMDSGGLKQAGLRTNEPSARGGDVASRRAIHQYPLARVLMELDRSYYKYLYGSVPENFAGLRAGLAQVKSNVGMVPEGKMTWFEFKEAAYDAYSAGEIPEMFRTIADEFRNFTKHFEQTHADYWRELQATNPEVGPLFHLAEGDELGPGVNNYLHQRYDRAALSADQAGFVEAVADHVEAQQLASFTKAHKRFLDRQVELQAELDFARLTPEERAEALVQARATTEAMLESENLKRYFDLRDEMRATPEYQEASRSERAKFTKEFHEGLDEETNTARLQFRDAKRTVSFMRRLGGDDVERASKLSQAIETGERLLGEMLESVAPGLRRLDKAIEDLPSNVEAVAASVLKDIQRAERALQGHRAALAAELRKVPTAEAQQAVEQFAVREADYLSRLDRYNGLKGKPELRDERLTELAELRDIVLDDLVQLAKRRARRVAEAEEALADVEARRLTPEEVGAETARIERQLLDNEMEFDQTWRDKGDRSGEPSKGKPNFRESATEDATYLYQKLIGADSEPGYYLPRGEARGPQLRRMLMLPYEVKKRWLDRDIENVATIYANKMGADLELYRALDGRPSGRGVMEAASREAHELIMRSATSSFVRLPKGFITEADALISRINKRIGGLTDTSGIRFESSSFSNTAKEGFVPLTPDLRRRIGAAINADLAAQQRNVDVAIKRMRGTRAQSVNEGGFMHRSGRVVKDANVFTMMGMVGVSSIPDPVRAIFQFGASRVVGKGWAPFIANIKGDMGRTFRSAGKEANQRIGLTLEVQLSGRFKEFNDLAITHSQRRTKFERGVTALSNATGNVALFNHQTNLFRSVTADVIHATMGEYVPTVARALKAGNVTGEALNQLEWLRRVGLRDNDILRIDAAMSKPGGMEEFSNGGKIPNFDAWEDLEAFRAYAGAVSQETNRLVIKPGLERPNWMDENLAFSMVGQFQSFLFAIHSRLLLSGLQGNEPYVISGIMASLGAGTVSYYLAGMVTGGKAWEERQNASPKRVLFMALDRSGLLGALHLPLGWGESVPYLNEFALFGGHEPGQYTSSSSMAGALGGPSVGQGMSALDLIRNIAALPASKDPGANVSRSLSRMRRLALPYQNVFYLRRAMTAVADAVGL